MPTAYSDALIAYGHGAVEINFFTRVVKQVEVPPGMCVVSVVDVGDEARFSVQAAFHELCKLANESRGRSYRTWILNPLMYQGEIEAFINDRTSDIIAENPVTKQRGPIITKLHIATSGTMTPSFVAMPWAGNGKKSGLHWLSTAGGGNWFNKYRNNSNVTVAEVKKCLEDCARPYEDAIERIQGEVAELRTPPISSATWDRVLQEKIHYEMPTIQRLCAGKTVVFYNIPCRVSEYNFGAETRSMFAPAREASGQHAEYAGRFRRPLDAKAAKLIGKHPALNAIQENDAAGIRQKKPRVTGFKKDKNGDIYAIICTGLTCITVLVSTLVAHRMGFFGGGKTRRNRKIRNKTRKYSRRNT